MAKTISFIVLVILILLVGGVFFVVMKQFVLPLFLALLLVIMFRPLHEWLQKKFPKYPHVSAALTTISIVTIALIPLLLVSIQAGMEGVAVAQSADPEQLVMSFQKKFSNLSSQVRDWAQHLGVTVPPDHEIASDLSNMIKSSIAPAALRTTQFLGSILFGFAIMLVSMYFFFADGPEMLDAIVKLTPMDPEYVRHLLTQFDQVSRAVVLATLLGALGQGILAGIAYFAVGMPHLFLITAITALNGFGAVCRGRGRLGAVRALALLLGPLSVCRRRNRVRSSGSRSPADNLGSIGSRYGRQHYQTLCPQRAIQHSPALSLIECYWRSANSRSDRHFCWSHGRGLPACLADAPSWRAKKQRKCRTNQTNSSGVI